MMATKTFNIGDKVNYTGWKIFFVYELWDGEKFIKLDKKQEHNIVPLKNTYIRGYINYLGVDIYVVEHDKGMGKEQFMKQYSERSNGLGDSFKASIHSSELDDNKKYIFADPSELELVERVKITTAA